MKLITALLTLILGAQTSLAAEWVCDNGYARRGLSSLYGAERVSLSPNADGTYTARYASLGSDVGTPTDTGIQIASTKMNCTFSQKHAQVVYCIDSNGKNWTTLNVTLNTYASISENGNESTTQAAEVILSGSQLPVQNNTLRFKVLISKNRTPNANNVCGPQP